MREYSQYDATTGMIVCSGICQDEVFDLMDYVIGGAYDDSHFFVNLDTHEAAPFPDKPSPYHQWDWSLKSWISNAKCLDDARKGQALGLDVICKGNITSGFKSSALGLEYNYPSKETDQANLNASVTASMYPGLPQDWITPFWCERDGQWRYRMHTAAQIQQVGFDGKNAALSFLAKNADLQEQLANAQTIEDIMAVQW